MGDHDFLDYCIFGLQVVNDAQFVREGTACGKDQDHQNLSTRNSAIADKPREAFRGQSRSSNMVPFHKLGMVSH